MEKKDVDQFEGKQVRIVLNSGRLYTGKILSINTCTILMEDQKGFSIKISIKDISAVEDLNKIMKDEK